MAKHTKQRGYYELKTEDGSKWLHFSMNFIFNLQEVTGEDLSTWSARVSKTTDEMEQAVNICDMVFAAMAAYDQEEENPLDYNRYAVRNWVFDAINNDDKVATEIMEAFTASMGKLNGKKKVAKK